MAHIYVIYVEVKRPGRTPLPPVDICAMANPRPAMAVARILRESSAIHEARRSLSEFAIQLPGDAVTLLSQLYAEGRKFDCSVRTVPLMAGAHR